MPKYRPSFPQKGGQMGMMQQIQKLQEQLVQAQEQLAQETGGKYFDNINSYEKINEEIQNITGFPP